MKASLYPSARAGVVGNVQYILQRESSWDDDFNSRKAQLEIPNVHTNFANYGRNESYCGVSMKKGIVLWNAITCEGECGCCCCLFILYALLLESMTGPNTPSASGRAG